MKIKNKKYKSKPIEKKHPPPPPAPIDPIKPPKENLVGGRFTWGSRYRIQTGY
tara:strand:- start:65 stop:223 length:159 start_codon:yes stop_codon:yes gene_type:complete